MIIHQNSFNYKINNNNFTAKTITSNNARDNVIIPKYTTYFSNKYIITKIGKKTFDSNEQITKVTFANDSEIQSLGREAFTSSSIEIISIPKSVKKIGDLCFSQCTKLKYCHIPEDSELESFGFGPFKQTKIESIFIPPKVSKIDQFFIIGFRSLKTITISPLNTYLSQLKNGAVIRPSDKSLVFVPPNVRYISIPKFIKKIENFAVSDCSCLRTVCFDADSELDDLGNSFLDNCLLVKSVSIPKNVKDHRFVYDKVSFSEFLSDSFVVTFQFFHTKDAIVALPNCRRAFFEYKYDTIVTLFILPYANVRAEDQSKLFDEIEFVF